MALFLLHYHFGDLNRQGRGGAHSAEEAKVPAQQQRGEGEALAHREPQVQGETENQGTAEEETPGQICQVT